MMTTTTNNADNDNDNDDNDDNNDGPMSAFQGLLPTPVASSKSNALPHFPYLTFLVHLGSDNNIKNDGGNGSENDSDGKDD